MRRYLALGAAFLLLSATARADAGFAIHQIRPGETLPVIAETSGSSVQALLEANPDIDAHALQPGTTIRIPANDRWLHYTVVRGDTMFAVARRFDTTVEEIRTASRLDGTQLEVGNTPTEVIDRADEALYYVKEHGRDNVAVFEQLVASGKL
ncbi:MAG: LysM peptidoglycan-binding domain-containing protein, partial [Proteobacteria bacterium]|nr:LysM peptidoglycan-binding domain-containing protein [Pseudomonadota bacterium]